MEGQHESSDWDPVTLTSPPGRLNPIAGGRSSTQPSLTLLAALAATCDTDLAWVVMEGQTESSDQDVVLLSSPAGRVS